MNETEGSWQLLSSARLTVEISEARVRIESTIDDTPPGGGSTNT